MWKPRALSWAAMSAAFGRATGSRRAVSQPTLLRDPARLLMSQRRLGNGAHEPVALSEAVQ